MDVITKTVETFVVEELRRNADGNNVVVALVTYDDETSERMQFSGRGCGTWRRGPSE